MKATTFWFICCIGLLYSEGSADRFNRDRQARRGRGHQQHASPSLQDYQLKATAPVTMHIVPYSDKWILETIFRNPVHQYPAQIIIFPIQCPQLGLYYCFKFYHHYSETTTNKIDAAPAITRATTKFNDKIDTTTQESEYAGNPIEGIGIGSRFGNPSDQNLKVNFQSYYNTTTGVDLNIVHPLRKPTIKIPPVNHNFGATEISSQPRPLQNPPESQHRKPASSFPMLTTQKNEFNDDVYFGEPTVHQSATTRSSSRTKTPTKRTRTTPVTKSKNFRKPTPTPIFSDARDQDAVNFDNTDENVINLKKSTTVRETPTTTSPPRPYTYGKVTKKYQDDSILFNNGESNTEGITRVLFEKRDEPDLDQAIKDCCKRTSITGCFESKGFSNLERNPCEHLLRRGWNEN